MNWKYWQTWLLALALAAQLASTVNSWAGMLSAERGMNLLIALLYGIGIWMTFQEATEA